MRPGLLWGTFLGVVYSVIGQLIGAAIIFFISRKFGRQIHPQACGAPMPPKQDRRPSRSEMGPQLVFWWRMMPVSFDFAAYAAGLTAMSFRLFIVARVLRLHHPNHNDRCELRRFP